jgi:hypothetical protein
MPILVQVGGGDGRLTYYLTRAFQNMARARNDCDARHVTVSADGLTRSPLDESDQAEVSPTAPGSDERKGTTGAAEDAAIDDVPSSPHSTFPIRFRCTDSGVRELHQHADSRRFCPPPLAENTDVDAARACNLFLKSAYDVSSAHD